MNGVQSYNEILNKSESGILYSSSESNNDSVIHMSNTSESLNISTSQNLNKISGEYNLEDHKADYDNISNDIPLACEDKLNPKDHKLILSENNSNKIFNLKVSVIIPKILKLTCEYQNEIK